MHIEGFAPGVVGKRLSARCTMARIALSAQEQHSPDAHAIEPALHTVESALRALRRAPLPHFGAVPDVPAASVRPLPHLTAIPGKTLAPTAS